MFDDRYEVEREDYKNFIETFNPKFRRIEEDYNNAEEIVMTKVYSTKTNELMAARVTYDNKPEQYFIFKLPSPEEALPPVRKRKITLDDRKQVQAFFDGLRTMQELYNHV